LGCEEAKPNFLDCWVGAPEGEKLLKVSGPRGNLRRDRGVDRDLCVKDVFKNALVGCRLATLVMLWLKSVDGHYDIQLFVLIPLGGDDAERTGDHLSMNAPRFDLRNKLLKFSVPDKGITPHQRNVKRFACVKQCENAGNQFIALKIRELAKKSMAAKMG